MWSWSKPVEPPVPLHEPEPKSKPKTVAVVYYKSGATEEFTKTDDWMPFPHFLPGFVEFDGVFVNADLIRTIEMKEVP